MEYIAFILICVLTSVASGAHGGNFVTKGVVIAGHVIACISILALLGAENQILPLGIILSGMWWVLQRSSMQAIAELDFQSKKDRTVKNLKEILISYYSVIPTFILGVIFLDPYLSLTYLVTSFLFIIGGSWIFHKSTKLGKKLHANAVNKVKKLVRQGKTPNYDKVLDERRAVELTTGFIPGGFSVFIWANVILYFQPEILNLINQVIN